MTSSISRVIIGLVIASQCLLGCGGKGSAYLACENLGVDDGGEEGALTRKSVQAGKGGVLSLKTGARVEIDGDALEEDTTIAIERPKEERARELASRLKSYRDVIASAPYVLTPHGTKFTKEAHLTLPISKEKRDARLAVAWLEDEDDQVWKFLAEPQVEGDRASVPLKHFSVVMLVDLDEAELEMAAQPSGGSPGGVVNNAGDAGATAVGGSSPGGLVGNAGDAGATVVGGSPGGGVAGSSADAGAISAAGAGGAGGSSADAGAIANVNGTLVSLQASGASQGISVPHTIVLLDGASGLPLNPPGGTTTASGTGSFSIPAIVAGQGFSAHVRGQGPASDSASTFDTVLLDFNPIRDPLVRIGSVGTANLHGSTAGFTARADRAQLLGTLYVTNSGRRVGTVGCAKLYLDGAADVSTDGDQRYVGSTGLPVPLAMLAQTSASRGAFYFGNIARGMHTLRVSMDDGQSFIASKSFFIPFSRAEAASEYKDMLVQLAIDIEGANPTPSGCAN